MAEYHIAEEVNGEVLKIETTDVMTGDRGTPDSGGLEGSVGTGSGYPSVDRKLSRNYAAVSIISDKEGIGGSNRFTLLQS